MIEFDAHYFIAAATEMKRLATVLHREAKETYRTELQKSADINIISQYRNQLEYSGFLLSMDQIDRIMFKCRPDRVVSNNQMATMVDELSTRMED